MSEVNAYCTLFDIRYLSRGLAMYESLRKVNASFHLYIFPFCDESLNLLTQLQLKHVTIVSLADFETPELLEVKKTRTAGEYCWTCTPAIIEHVLNHFQEPHCTYLDADLYFFSDPSVLIDEMGDNQILLTEHRYTPKYDHAKVSGIYCVQFMCFKAQPHGLEALAWWREKCLEWCHAWVEPDRFGDQKYLDDWTQRFQKVHVLRHWGGGLAPWNIQQVSLKMHQAYLQGALDEGENFKVIFYHFHQLQLAQGSQVDLGGYQLSRDVLENIYKPYINHLNSIESRLKPHLRGLDIHGRVNKKGVYAKLKRMVHGCNNIYPIRRFIYG